ncbi:MAG: single-stranded DNA-binding protein [Treponema sp.]|nr:single-stranded DNA-binding protein [Treponema sp.]
MSFAMMSAISSLIDGCLTREPQFRTAPEGGPVCTFTIASNHSYKSEGGLEKEVSFFDVETRGKLAERCRDLGRKMGAVRVVGRLKQERWDGDDGRFHAKVFIVADHVEFWTKADVVGECDLEKREEPLNDGFKKLPF